MGWRLDVLTEEGYDPDDRDFLSNGTTQLEAQSVFRMAGWFHSVGGVEPLAVGRGTPGQPSELLNSGLDKAHQLCHDEDNG